MPVEIRELVIKTHIAGAKPAEPPLTPEKLAQLRQQIVQECLKQLGGKAARKKFDR
jgi:hypothetical protein